MPQQVNLTNADSALCTFNINQDMVFKLTEKKLLRILKEDVFEEILSSGLQGEVIVFPAIHKKVFARCMTKPFSLVLGGNVGNIADELSECICCEILTPFNPKLGRNLFSHPDKIFINGISLPSMSKIDRSSCHLIFETEKRRIIVTPAKKFSLTKKMRLFAKRRFKLAVFSGCHLLSYRELQLFINFCNSSDSEFKFFEMGHFQDQQCFDLVAKRLLPNVSMVGMSYEELCQLGAGALKQSSKSYIVHSKGHIMYSPAWLKPYVLRAGSYTSKLYNDKGITVGLGDRFSGFLLKQLLRHDKLKCF